MDDNGHGTHVAGTIGATGNNGVGVAGLNWSVKIIPCKFIDANNTGYTSDAVECFNYLKGLKGRPQDPVNISAVNASFGSYDYSKSLYDAIKAMGDTLVIAAAGNDGSNSDAAKVYPANFGLSNIIAVAATDNNDLLASWSNYGKYTVDTGAPGTGILSTWLGGQYKSLSGTSMAAPHVTGLAALLKAQDPFRTGFKIKNLILSAGDSISSLNGKVSSDKRINANGSINCFDSTLLSVGRLPFLPTAGTSYPLSAYSVRCGDPMGVSVTTESGGSIDLTDGGNAPDQTAGDGVFTGSWTAGAGPTLLSFTSSSGQTAQVTVPPLKAGFLLADAKVDVPYSQALTVTGGWAPYRSWSIKSGQLPAGLSLDGSTGVISGTAATAGDYQFAVEVVDARSFKASTSVTLRVVTDEVEQAWGRSLGGDGSDSGNAIVSDSNGNSYVTGNVYNGSSDDVVLIKYDRSGRMLWSRSYDLGDDERAGALTVDATGNIYVAGYKDKYTLTYFLMKCDADGNMLWEKPWASQWLYDPKVAADAAGNVYTASMVGYDEPALVLEKRDSNGNRIWNKLHPTVGQSLASAYALAVDAAGNLYFGGISSYRDGAPAEHEYLLAKYDTAGNLLWSKTAADENVFNVIEGMVIVDGNIFASGWANGSGTRAYGVTMRYDLDGNMLWKTKTAGETGGCFYGGGIAVASGAVYTIGNTISADGISGDYRTLKFDASGNEVWKKILNVHPTSIAADIAGVTLSGFATNANNSDIITARYNDDKTPSDDLSLAGLSGAMNGNTLTYTVTVKNSGVGSPRAAVSLNFSTDAVASPDDYVIAVVDAGSVPGGTEKTLTGSVTVPLTIPVGSYHLAAIADPANAVNETDEANNGAVAAGAYDIVTATTDLEVTAASAWIYGGQLQYTVTVKNSGNVPLAASSTALYLWDGKAVDKFNYRATSLSTDAIAVGGQQVLSGAVPVPATIPAGSYSVLVRSDDDSVIAETNENNNVVVADQVTLSNDLSITGLSAFVGGSSLNYTVKVRNVGTGNATAVVALTISSDAVSSTDDRKVAELNLGNLPGNTEKTFTGAVSWTPHIPDGKYYLLAFADPANAVVETNEGNNAATAGPYDVINWGADLQISSITASVAAGKVNYSMTVKNAGNVSAGIVTADLYLWAGGAAAPIRIASLEKAGLAAGGQTVITGSVSVPATIPPGSYYFYAVADPNNAVNEIDNENNKATAANQLTLFDDLSITGVSGTIDGTVSYAVKVKNAGTGNPNALVSLYLSSDAVASINDIPVAQVVAGSVAGGSEKTLTGSIAVPANVANGSYYLCAVADPANAVVESNESNNGAVGPQVAVNRDLQVQSVSGTVASGKVTYSVVVKNAGNLAAVSTSTGIFLSTDGTASSNDYLVGKISTSTIQAGGQALLTGSIALPATIPPGSYTLAAIADVNGQVTEIDEGNNGAVGEQVTVANDLSVTGLSATLTNGQLAYSVKVKNSGTGSAAPGVVLYFSPDAAASVNDYVVAKVTGSGIPAGTEQLFTGTVAVPGTIPSGTYYLAALADASNAVVESDEQNNGAVAGQFTVSSDLEVTAVSATLVAGKLSYSMTVKNSGNVASPSSSTALYLSVDGTASRSGYSVVAISTPALAAGGVTTLSGTAALPATVPSGRYAVAAIADNLNVMKEINESNNGAVGNQVTVSNDFSITGLSGALSNGRLTYTIKVANAGTSSSAATVGVYFSTDQVPATSDYLITKAKAASVPGGTEVTVTGTVAVPDGIPAGTYYLAAVADPDGAATETSETNNGAVANQFTLNRDVAIESVSATLGAGKLNYLVTLRNNGNVSLPASTTGLYLSTDGTASRSGYSVASIATPAVAVGGMATLTGTAALPGTVPAGTYTVVAFADNAGAMNETNETNNGAVGNAVSFSNDLTITGISGNLSNGQLYYTVNVGNSGAGNPSASVALYFSADDTASTGDYLITTKTGSVPGGTGAILTGSAPVPAGIPSGTYYLVALADPGSSIVETNESNNGAAGAQFTVNTDVQVESVSATLAAGKVSYIVTVRNYGNVAAAASSTGLYLSVDGTASKSGYSVAALSTGVIAPGAVVTLRGSVALAATVPPGSYRIAAIADNADQLMESSEGNNGAVGNAIVVSNDLSITAFSGTLSNGQLTYTVRVNNSGSGNPSTSVALYFSSDQLPTTGDYLLATKTAAFPGGTETTLTGTVAVPAGIPSGTYYLVALADPGSITVESSESNNGAVAGQYTVNRDLQIAAVSGTVSAGSLTYSVTVRNTGNTPTVASTTGLYLSKDATAATSDYKVASVSTVALAPGGEKVITGTVTIPSTVPAGSYYVAAVADIFTVVKESNTANNGAVGNTVTR